MKGWVWIPPALRLLDDCEFMCARCGSLSSRAAIELFPADCTWCERTTDAQARKLRARS